MQPRLIASIAGLAVWHLTAAAYAAPVEAVFVYEDPTQDNNYGFQSFSVPESGIYSVYAYGAQGGGNNGATGAVDGGLFNLTAGQTFDIVVGGQGAFGPLQGGGGGGGTFIVFAGTAVPLLIAGGGGGGSASAGRPGNSSTGGSDGVQGSSQQPDEGFGGDGGNGGGGSTGPGGGGGGGFLTAGGDGVPAFQQGGQSYLSGAQGGGLYESPGGFGGGGAGGFSGGGGGGFSGGGAGAYEQGGGGGGSFANSAYADGFAGGATGAAPSGDGLAYFVLRTPAMSSVPLPSAAPLFGAALIALGAAGYAAKRKTAAAD